MSPSPETSNKDSRRGRNTFDVRRLNIVANSAIPIEPDPSLSALPKILSALFTVDLWQPMRVRVSESRRSSPDSGTSSNVLAKQPMARRCVNRCAHTRLGQQEHQSTGVCNALVRDVDHGRTLTSNASSELLLRHSRNVYVHLARSASESHLTPTSHHQGVRKIHALV